MEQSKLSNTGVIIWSEIDSDPIVTMYRWQNKSQIVGEHYMSRPDGPKLNHTILSFLDVLLNTQMQIVYSPK